jgi:hypothetical protein
MKDMTLPKAAVLAAAAFVLVSCSSEPAKKAEKEPEKPAEPVGGRYAFHQAFITARTWATDLQLLRVRNLPLENLPSAPGKAAVWEVTFVSPGKQRSRAYMYSVVEQENIHKGVYGGLEESYTGAKGQAAAFPTAALKIDTPDAWETAAAKSKEYMQKNPNSVITYLLEKTPRHPNPTWRVIWGTSAATSGYSIYVDATTGEFLERMR